MKTELVTTLKRQATRILAELHETKEPILITEHGQPSAYLIDVDDFERIISVRPAFLQIGPHIYTLLVNCTWD